MASAGSVTSGAQSQAAVRPSASTSALVRVAPATGTGRLLPALLTIRVLSAQGHMLPGLRLTLAPDDALTLTSESNDPVGLRP
jgi:hypothetical protein